MGYPCFGSKEQFRLLTDKTAFIRKCIECGVDVIPQYTEQDFVRKEDCPADFPVFVKPCDSRGSRGQTICHSFAEISDAIAFAKSESKTGKVIIEKFMGDKQDFSMSYLVIDGVPHLVRTGDRYVGAPETKMNKSAICGVSPSGHLDLYLHKVDEKIKRFISAVGIKNGPVFMQGFVDGNTIRFFDPAMRLPGANYELILKQATGIDIMSILIKYALTGEMDETETKLLGNAYKLNGKMAAIVFPVMRTGVISKIEGLENIGEMDSVIGVYRKHREGQVIEATGDISQRIAEIDMLCDTKEQLVRDIQHLRDMLTVKSIDGEEMITSNSDLTLL